MHGTVHSPTASSILYWTEMSGEAKNHRFHVHFTIFENTIAQIKQDDINLGTIGCNRE